MYPEQDEDSKTIPLQPADSGASPANGQNMSQQSYNTANGQNMYQQNCTAPNGQNMYQQNYTAPNGQNMYQQNYTAPNGQNMYQQNYTAPNGQNMYQQNYTAPNGQNMYQQNYNASYGQNQGYPQQNYQNPYYVNPAVSPQNQNTAAPKKKKSKLPLIIVLIVILLAAIGAGIFFFVKKNGASGSPKETVSAAVSKTFSSDAPSALSSYLGTDELSTMTSSGAYQESFDLTITDIGGFSMPSEAYLINGLGFSGNMALDADKKQMASDISITYGGISYLSCKLFAYDDFLALAFPDFFDGYLEVNTTTMSTDYANSYLATILGSNFSIPSDYSFNTFDFIQSQASNTAVPVEMNDFMDNIEFAKGETADIELNGKSQSCQGYDVTVTTQAIQELADWFYTYATQCNVEISRSNIDSILPKDDITFTVYVDNKGRMVQLTYKDSFPVENTTLDVDANITFSGTDRPTDQVSGQINMSADGSTFCIDINSNTSESGSSSTTDTIIGVNIDGSSIGCLSYNSTLDTASGTSTYSLSVDGMGQNYLSVTMDGTYSNVVAGKSMRYDINDLTVNVMSGEYRVSLSGSMSLEPLSGSVEQPSGTCYQLFSMSEADFNTLGEEIVGNLYSSPLFSLIMGSIDMY